MTAPPVVRHRNALLTHGFASSWEHNWVQYGWPDLLSDAGITARPFALPGHIASEIDPHAPVDQIAGAALTAAGDADVAIGFSLGSAVILHAALADPSRFRRIALLGFGDGTWTEPGHLASLADRLVDPNIDEPDITLLRRASRSAGDDVDSIAAFLREFPGPPPLDDLSAINAEVLLVLGQHDSAGPATRTSAALRSASVVVLPGVDHWRTPGSQSAMSAVVDFLS